MLVMTRSVNDRVALDVEFAKLVTNSITRFVKRVWGEMDDEDTKANNWAIDNGERVLAAYGTEPHKIWIIRERDVHYYDGETHNGGTTTVLFPSEY